MKLGPESFLVEWGNGPPTHTQGPPRVSQELNGLLLHLTRILIHFSRFSGPVPYATSFVQFLVLLRIIFLFSRFLGPVPGYATSKLPPSPGSQLGTAVQQRMS